MASLIETLVTVLDKQNDGYMKMLELSKIKTTAIVEGNVDQLQELLVQEQEQIDALDKLEEERRINVNDICTVLNLQSEHIRIDDIIRILEKRPKEHDALVDVHVRLKRTLDQLMQINENNKMLLKESMDMIDFELNLAKSAMIGPQMGGYDNGAYEQENAPIMGRFDAKQ